MATYLHQFLHTQMSCKLVLNFFELYMYVFMHGRHIMLLLNLTVATTYIIFVKYCHCHTIIKIIISLILICTITQTYFQFLDKCLQYMALISPTKIVQLFFSFFQISIFKYATNIEKVSKINIMIILFLKKIEGLNNFCKNRPI